MDYWSYQSLAKACDTLRYIWLYDKTKQEEELTFSESLVFSIAIGATVGAGVGGIGAYRAHKNPQLGKIPGRVFLKCTSIGALFGPT